ncbi:MAG: hypothetical protein K0R54_86 [Clostridiaceae bacterium]|nr:hypothetical protein [Clostridiaceae bacterium]
MIKNKWRKNGFIIVYKNPSIQPFRENLIKSIKDVMYFYYDIDIFFKRNKIFHAEAYDFPKVQNLDKYIDYIVDMNEKDMFVYENIEDNGFCRKKLYNFIDLGDIFDIEYFYKIEKIVTYVKQSYENEYKRFEEYTLRIGKCKQNKSYGKEVFIKNLTKEDIINLKEKAIEFCSLAIQDYNENLKKRVIKCPKCEKHQLYLEAFAGIKEHMEEQIKCIYCENEFSINDDIYIN